MKLLKTAGALLALSLLAGHGIAQVTVPNTFTAGTPAKAAEVNANFTALVNAINNLQIPSAATPVPSGYSGNGAFADTNTLTGRNVIVLRRTLDSNQDGNTDAVDYQVRMAYTTAPNYVYQQVDLAAGADGLTISGHKRRIDTMSGTNETEFAITQYVETSSATVPSVIARTFTAKRLNFGPAHFGVLRGVIMHQVNDDTGHVNIMNQSRLLALVSGSALDSGGSIDIGGLLYTSASTAVRIQFNPGGSVVQAIVRNLGMVMNMNEDYPMPFVAIWYRVQGVNGGAPVGSLTGTPFAASEALYGAYFTP